MVQGFRVERGLGCGLRVEGQGLGQIGKAAS